jgi:putative DNA primase/helicase
MIEPKIVAETIRRIEAAESFDGCLAAALEYFRQVARTYADETATVLVGCDPNGIFRRFFGGARSTADAGRRQGAGDGAGTIFTRIPATLARRNRNRLRCAPGRACQARFARRSRLISPARIAAARGVDIRDAARQLGLKLRRATPSEFVGACPKCGGDDRFSINRKKSLFNCRKCGKAGDVIGLVRHTLDVDFREAVSYLAGEGPRDVRPSSRAAPVTESPAGAGEEAVRHFELAMRIWREAVDPRSTPVEMYLASRAIELPAEAAVETLRYHPRCPFGGQHTAAMISLVRNIKTDRPQAVHRTALTPEGRKAIINGSSRLSLGPTGGGAIKISPDEHVTYCLGIGEGVESTLSMRGIPEFGVRSPIWAVLSARGVSKFPILAGVETLWIGVDHDQVGIDAAEEIARRWTAGGREIFLIKPRASHKDLNDLATARRVRH